jgi:S-adenosylmethionine:tRNA ribosyltransferase-isomerase
MKVDAFDFHLPEERIALRPVEPRDAARLLVVSPSQTPQLADRIVRDLPDLLRPGDALVFNDTRVIPARLRMMRPRGAERAKIELLLHRRLDAARWLAFARPAKKLKAGDELSFSGDDARVAEVVSRGEGGEVEIGFRVTGPALDALIAQAGEMPLPPYIAGKRPTDARDAADYQTVYARHDGSVAAPTAGLHFTPDLLARLAECGVSQHFLTLHVGAGTFLPVKAEDTSEHRMHAEYAVLTRETAEALNAARRAGGRIVAVGTTSMRTLESAADADGSIRPFQSDTSIFITPGYRFRACDMLMTNFHLPRSTLFMLVSAFCGLQTMQAAYAHAIATGYRFYSYGDSSLLTRG